MEKEIKKIVIPDENFRLAFEKVITEKTVVKNRKMFKLILDLLIQEKGFVSLDILIKEIYRQMYGDDFNLDSIWRDSEKQFVKKILKQMDKYVRNLKCRIQFIRGRKNVPTIVYIERLSGYLKFYDDYISRRE